MNQNEIVDFFAWAEENLSGFVGEECDESVHFYWKDTFMGGYAGDSRQWFYKQSDVLAQALRMMDAANSQ